MKKETQPLTPEEKRAKRLQEFRQKLADGTFEWSFSGLSRFAESPVDFLEYQIGERKVTPTMEFSSMVHVLVLEGEEAFDKRYTFQPENVDAPTSPQAGKFCDLVFETGDHVAAFKEAYSTKGKSEEKIEEEAVKKLQANADWINFLRDVQGREIIKAADRDLALRVRDRLLVFPGKSKELLTALPKDGREVWFDGYEIDGMKFRGKKDGVGSGYKLDLKVLAGSSRRYVHRDIFNKLYHCQGAIYNHGSDDKYFLIVADKNNPVGSSVHLLVPPTLEMGMERVQKEVKMFRHCQVLDAWNESHEFRATTGEIERVFDVYPPWWYDPAE